MRKVKLSLTIKQFYLLADMIEERCDSTQDAELAIRLQKILDVLAEVEDTQIDRIR